MDFIKKNWGLLLYALGCLILALLIGYKISVAAREAGANRKALEEQLEWFRQVRKDNVKLTNENEKAAQDNRDRAERAFEDLRRTMATKYRIEPRHPSTAVEAVRSLQDEIRALARTLDAAETPVDYSRCPAFSFLLRAQSKDLPAKEDIPLIFRQLRIIQEVVRIVAQSHLQSLDSIERPLDLAVIEEDLYTATPVVMTVTGTPEQVQTFINKISTEANYLFFLRTLAVETADQAANGAIGSIAAPAVGAGMGAGMGPGMGMMDPAMGMMDPGMGMEPAMGAGGGAPRASTFRRPGRRGQAGAGMDPAAGMPGMDMPGMEGAMGRTGAAGNEPRWRDDLRPFEADRPITATLRFDVIEFNQPDANP